MDKPKLDGWNIKIIYQAINYYRINHPEDKRKNVYDSESLHWAIRKHIEYFNKKYLELGVLF
jgi:hypothetical protein